MVAQRIDDRTEDLGVAVSEMSVGNEVQHFGELGVPLDVGRRVVALGVDAGHFLLIQSEQEEVLRARLLQHLHVGAVERADGQRAIDHELHVPRAGGLFARGRDLLGQIGGRVDQMCVLHIEVRHENDLHETIYVRVGVDGRSDGVDQFDDPLGHEVPGRGFAAEDERPRGNRQARVLLEPLYRVMMCSTFRC